MAHTTRHRMRGERKFVGFADAATAIARSRSYMRSLQNERTRRDPRTDTSLYWPVSVNSETGRASIAFEDIPEERTRLTSDELLRVKTLEEAEAAKEVMERPLSTNDVSGGGGGGGGLILRMWNAIKELF